MSVAFFFRAEGGIRDGHVTGVQTCALPIWPSCSRPLGVPEVRARQLGLPVSTAALPRPPCLPRIGRASCRDRVQTACCWATLRGHRQRRAEQAGRAAWILLAPDGYPRVSEL